MAAPQEAPGRVASRGIVARSFFGCRGNMAGHPALPVAAIRPERARVSLNRRRNS
ncbi:hypothetical protein RMHFA_05698 [Roseomonas mucosa]|jgi:hypothetical protein|nr:hypothetical protein RMHFA_05698 [Roseomonas mucosa]